MAPSFHQFALGFLGLVVAGAGVAATVVAYRGPQEHTVSSVATERTALLPPPAPAAVPLQPEPQSELPNVAFDLDAIAGGAPVPRRTGWPPDETAADATGGRLRQEFIELVLPLALLANEEVVGERMRLWEVLQRNNAGNLTSEDRLWLAWVSDNYNVQEGDFPELVQRVDIVPPSILVAVAAWSTQWSASNEAGWQSLFRSAVTATQGKSEGALPEKKAQPSPLDALHLYMKMANTHPDFLPFRRARERLRQTSAPLRGSALMATLPRIAPGRLPGALAVFDLISDQRLERFDSASLAPR